MRETKACMERVLSRTTPRFLTDVDRFMDVVSSSSVSGVGSCESFWRDPISIASVLLSFSLSLLCVFQSTQTSGREKCRSREKYASFITYFGGPIRVNLKSCMILQHCFGVYRCHV